MLESKTGKKGEIWQQGDLDRRYNKRDTDDPIAGNYQRGRKETLHRFGRLKTSVSSYLSRFQSQSIELVTRKLGKS